MMNKFYLFLALSILSQCICVEFLDISSYFGSGISRNTRSKPKPAPKSEIGTRLNKFSFIIHLNFFFFLLAPPVTEAVGTKKEGVLEEFDVKAGGKNA